MTAERKSPPTLSGIPPEATPSYAPEAELAHHPVRPARATIAPPPGAVSVRRSTSTDSGLSWSSLLGIEQAPPPRDPSSPGGRRPHSETRRVAPGEAKLAAGFYSSRPAPEFLSPPKSPDVATRPPPTSVISRDESAATRPMRSPSSESSATEERGTPSSRRHGIKASSPSAGDGMHEGGTRHPSSAPRRISFPTHIRQQADGWLKTGSLSLPNCSSPRHARAVQRALLLALLAQPGYASLPLGLKQRVGWLFSPGWESVPTAASLSELNDLMTVLGVSAELEAPSEFLAAVAVLIPDPLPLVRPPSSYPPARR